MTNQQGQPRSSDLVDVQATVATESDVDVVEANELIALIKAIKFAYHDYGCKRVHDEIKTHGGKYARVPLKRVKKYMQKLGMTNAQDSNVDQLTEATKAIKVNDDKSSTSSQAANTATNKSGNKTTANLKSQAQNASAVQGAMELMTIGGAVKSERPEPNVNHSQRSGEDEDVWLPVKLDEPASKLKKFPYQAVIRMTKNEEGDASGDMGEIYKIQVAMGPNGSLSSVDPMLVYNKGRTRRTFLHPDSPAYAPVQRLITARGLGGSVGGAKAYFWGRYGKKDDVVYINSEKLAPFQQW